ncbi:MAG: hypothetical protein PHV28_15430 [Kiritimatiellae bacterium]|nr:hypothetical protein [Kiritimatiellia bacterium]
MCDAIDPAVFIARVCFALKKSQESESSVDFSRLRKIRDSVSQKLAEEKHVVAIEWTRDAVMDSLDSHSVYLEKTGRNVRLCPHLKKEKRREYIKYVARETPVEIRSSLRKAIRTSLETVF